MVKMDFEIKSDNIKKAIEEKDIRVRIALMICGEMMERYAKEQLYPGHGKVTGNLQNSITHQGFDTYVIVGTNVVYAPYIELGSSRRRGGGYHFLRNAVEQHLQEYKDIIEKTLSS